jgi:hypothetical protein
MNEELKIESEVNPDDKKKELMLKMLRRIQENIDSLISLIEVGESVNEKDFKKMLLADAEGESESLRQPEEEGRVIEGVFNGEAMVGGDGKEYMVPANYASKSKLVEGDILKLTINREGNFVYKQIGPIDRQRVVGRLAYDKEKDEHRVLSDGRSWRVLSASISFYKGQAGDEIVIIVPKNNPSRWAAVENVIRK